MIRIWYAVSLMFIFDGDGSKYYIDKALADSRNIGLPLTLEYFLKQPWKKPTKDQKKEAPFKWLIGWSGRCY